MFVNTLLVQVWEGLNVVKTARQMLGETDPVSIYILYNRSFKNYFKWFLKF